MRPLGVLMVAYDFPPHAAIGTQRTVRVLRRLVQSGWRVSVLTGNPRSFRRGTPVDRGLLDRVPQDAGVIRAGAWRPIESVEGLLRALKRRTGPVGGDASPRGKSGAVSEGARRRGLLSRLARAVDVLTGIPDAEIGWLLPAIVSGFRAVLTSRPDVIYSSAPPWTGHLVATVLASLFRRPVVLDFRDPWARAPWRSARSAATANAAAQSLERFVIRRAAAVIFATRAAADEFARYYGAAHAGKFHLVPNGCDAALFDGLVPTTAEGASVLLHAGSLYGGRNPLSLLRAVAALVADKRVDRTMRVRFVGQVSLPGVDLARSCRELGIDDMVEFIPRLNHRAILQEMRSAAALLLLQPGTTMSVPAKAYEYLAAGRPVLALTEEGETAALIRASGLGCAVPPGDELAIADGLLDVLERSRADLPSPSASLYDGSLRAAETEAVLMEVLGRTARGCPHEAHDASVPRVDGI